MYVQLPLDRIVTAESYQKKLSYSTSSTPESSTHNATSESSGHVSAATVVGAAIGSTLFVALLMGLCILILHRRRRHRRRDSSLVQNVRIQTAVPVGTAYSDYSEYVTSTASDIDTDAQGTYHELPSYADIAGERVQPDEPQTRESVSVQAQKSVATKQMPRRD